MNPESHDKAEMDSSAAAKRISPAVIEIENTVIQEALNNLINIKWDEGQEWIDVLENNYDEALPWIYKILDGQMNLDMPLEDYNLSFRVWCMLVDHKDPRIFDYFLKAAKMSLFEIDPRFDILTLPDMLYRAWNGNYDGFEELVLDESCDDLNRYMAFRAMIQLYIDGLYDEDRFNEFIMTKALPFLFDPEADIEDAALSNEFVLAVHYLKLEDYKEMGYNLFDRNLVDPNEMSKDSFMQPPKVNDPKLVNRDAYKQLKNPRRLCRSIDEKFPTAWDCYEVCQSGFIQKQEEIKADTTILRDAFAKAQKKAKEDNIEFPSAPKQESMFAGLFDGLFSDLPNHESTSPASPGSGSDLNTYNSVKFASGLDKKEKKKKAKKAKAAKAARKAQRKKK